VGTTNSYRFLKPTTRQHEFGFVGNLEFQALAKSSTSILLLIGRMTRKTSTGIVAGLVEEKDTEKFVGIVSTRFRQIRRSRGVGRKILNFVSSAPLLRRGRTLWQWRIIL
jgi:hypothetical protein